MSQQHPHGHGLIVVGLARNCASCLPTSLEFCEALERAFSPIYFVLLENASEDATREMLETWVSNRAHAIVFTPKSITDVEFRTQSLAAYRNEALAFVRDKVPDLAAFDLLLNVDMDIGDGSVEGLAGAAVFLRGSRNAVGVFPNSTPLYYDIWALRHPFWCPFDVWQQVHAAKADHSQTVGSQTPPEALFVYSRQLQLPTRLAPINVISAFGGLGLYRLAVAIEGTYRGVDEAGRQTCEHVEYNKGLKGSLYILPSWCIKAPLEHLSSSVRLEYASARKLRWIRERRILLMQLRDKLMFSRRHLL